RSSFEFCYLWGLFRFFAPIFVVLIGLSILMRLNLFFGQIRNDLGDIWPIPAVLGDKFVTGIWIGTWTAFLGSSGFNHFRSYRAGQLVRGHFFWHIDPFRIGAFLGISWECLFQIRSITAHT